MYVGAILIIGGLLALIPRVRTRRVARAVTIAAAIMLLSNQLRFTLLGFVFASYDRNVFEWVHSLGGSSLMITALVVSLAVLFVMIPERAAPARPPAARHASRRRTRWNG